MVILGIESSFDETGASVIRSSKDNSHVTVLSNVLSTSLALHAKTGGTIPEVAAREQIKYIIPVIDRCLKDADMSENQIDAIAVTYGPGLIGSLLVGVETAKTLSYVCNKPLIPVNHLYGHIYANFVRKDSKFAAEIKFPALSLIASGGHTDLVLLEKHGSIKWLGGTRDDAAGEAFDKIGRLLGLPYPGGPAIERNAKKGNPKAYNFPRPMMYTKDFDFSFSGLKAAVSRHVQKAALNDKTACDIAASAQQAIIDVLIYKTLSAARKYNVHSLLLGGGVAANQTLTVAFKREIEKRALSLTFFVPPKNLCTDNAVMVASAGFFNPNFVSWKTLTANPELYF